MRDEKENDPWHPPWYRVNAMVECINTLFNQAKWCEECIKRKCKEADECKNILRLNKKILEKYAEHLGITLLFTIDIENWEVQPHPKFFKKKKKTLKTMELKAIR